MSKIVVNLQPESSQGATAEKKFSPSPSAVAPNATLPKPQRRGLLFKVLLVLAGLFLLAAVVGGTAGYWWWTNLQKSPAYSLALLIDAARKDDQPGVEQFLDTNAVIDDFVPQITEKATERYGRGFPPPVVAKATQQLQPLLRQVLPQIKEIARREIPRIIKEKSQAAPQTSPVVLAIGLGRVITVDETGDAAKVTANFQSREIEFRMRRNGDRWQIIGAKDEALADKIADQVAQKVLATVTQRQTTGKTVSNKDLIDDITRQIQQIIP